MHADSWLTIKWIIYNKILICIMECKRINHFVHLILFNSLLFIWFHDLFQVVHHYSPASLPVPMVMPSTVMDARSASANEEPEQEFLTYSDNHL